MLIFSNKSQIYGEKMIHILLQEVLVWGNKSMGEAVSKLELSPATKEDGELLGTLTQRSLSVRITHDAQQSRLCSLPGKFMSVFLGNKCVRFTSRFQKGFRFCSFDKTRDLVIASNVDLNSDYTSLHNSENFRSDLH